MYYRNKFKIQPTGVERPWSDNEIIVTKTTLKGQLTYTNDIFLRMAQMSEKEALGKPHNIIRHPEMPRCIFGLLWATLQSGKEIFAFVNNIAMNGDHYWVFAHVTPSYNAEGQVVGYHSNRRKPDPAQIAKIAPLYRSILQEERSTPDRKAGLQRSYDHLFATLRTQGLAYDEFVFAV